MDTPIIARLETAAADLTAATITLRDAERQVLGAHAGLQDAVTAFRQARERHQAAIARYAEAEAAACSEAVA